MTKLLVAEIGPQNNASISCTMPRRFVAEWRAAHPDGEVVEPLAIDAFASRPEPRIEAAAA